ncbi:hypothetical protein HY734_01740 [Candidatus Uhrbacteria bacterium]|nr:hypothetical protein [Candidatus Uhrbacteria bacterium]
MDERGPTFSRPRPAFSREQKVGFGLLLAIGLAGAVFGLWSIPSNLRRPFDVQLASYNGPEFLTLSEQESQEAARQKAADTDKDGLSDYDELFVFQTSPYLADSDSDGFDDKTEVYSGNNPNCPAGRDCTTAVVADSPEASSGGSADSVFSALFQGDATRFQNASFDSPEDIQAFLSELNADDIRAMMVAQGVPQQTIDQLTDEELMQLFQETVDQANASGTFDELLQGSVSGDGTAPAETASSSPTE